jgi:hypothetical protein
MKRSARGGGMDVGADDQEPQIDILDDDGNPISDDLPEPEIVTDEPAPAAADAPAGDDAFAVLKREKDAADAALAAERAKTAALERRTAGSEADLDATNAALLKNAAAQARAGVEAAKQAYAAAMAKSDFEAAGTAQAQIAERVAEAREFEAAIIDFEGEIAAKRAAPKTQPKPTQAAPADPAEAIISQMTPASAEWLRKNKERALGSQAKWSRTIAAHHAAVEAGHEIDTPAYFQFLEQDLNIKAPAPTSNTKPTPKRAPPMAAAPVTRGSDTTGTRGQVKLSQAERDSAKRLGMTLAQYGAYKLKAEQGAADPDYKGPRYSKDNPAISGRR